MNDQPRLTLEVIRLDPYDVAAAVMRAYAQLRLDMMLLTEGASFRSAAITLMNQIHHDLADTLGVDITQVSVVMAQQIMGVSKNMADVQPGGEDSSG